MLSWFQYFCFLIILFYSRTRSVCLMSESIVKESRLANISGHCPGLASSQPLTGADVTRVPATAFPGPWSGSCVKPALFYALVSPPPQWHDDPTLMMPAMPTRFSHCPGSVTWCHITLLTFSSLFQFFLLSIFWNQINFCPYHFLVPLIRYLNVT